MKTKLGLSYATRVTVYLDGKPIGEIRESLYSFSANSFGYRYFPKGTGNIPSAKLYPTIEACKKSLE